jgi:acetyl esterase
MAGEQPEVDGRTLDVDIALLAKLTARHRAGSLSVESVRAGERALYSITGQKPRRGVATHDRTIQGPAGPLPVRLYHPPDRTGVSPALVWFHAGGATIGGLHTTHSWCTVLAERAGLLVMSVDYRLAPEHPFPAAVDDALASYQWVIDNADGLGVDAHRVAIGGESAGGTLATVVCQERRRHGQPQPMAQLLVYPGTDATASGGSMDTCGACFPLDLRMIELFRRSYLPDPRAAEDPRTSPGRSEDLWGLAPAVIVTAGFDPLRDQGDAYAAALDRAGVRVIHRGEDSMSHSFLSMGLLKGPRAAGRRVADDMAALLADL